ncbi:heavy metal-binding domain-containing protein [Acidithiobacillus thiooxidans]|uniref:heavy metal-binding domain-containing protein n=1 Tax=Acidithiobacillus thiooxidans TaxID=930 RepID=UPI0035650C2B|nr:heavy metal-binding domain-containing protein [Acidithiobacillus sp.]
MKSEPDAVLKIPLSTTENSDQGAQIVTVVNRAMYGEYSARQSDETLEMLREKARKLGATAVVGVRLVPVVDDGITRMMAYGTARVETVS